MFQKIFNEMGIQNPLKKKIIQNSSENQHDSTPTFTQPPPKNLSKQQKEFLIKKKISHSSKKLVSRFHF